MKGLEFGWSERLVGGGRAKSLKTWADQSLLLTGPQSKGFGPALARFALTTVVRR
jgi:hypothetical protein